METSRARLPLNNPRQDLKGSTVPALKSRWHLKPSCHLAIRPGLISSFFFNTAFWLRRLPLDARRCLQPPPHRLVCWARLLALPGQATTFSDPPLTSLPPCPSADLSLPVPRPIIFLSKCALQDCSSRSAPSNSSSCSHALRCLPSERLFPSVCRVLQCAPQYLQPPRNRRLCGASTRQLLRYTRRCQ